MSTEPARRKPYLTDVSDEEWAFHAPYLTLINPAAPQRTHNLREVFNALRWLVRNDGQWRLIPHDLPPWEAVYQQTAAGWPRGALKRLSTIFGSY